MLDTPSSIYSRVAGMLPEHFMISNRLGLCASRLRITDALSGEGAADCNCHCFIEKYS